MKDIDPLELNQYQRLLSSQQLGWKGILVELYQSPLNYSFEEIVAALPAHWLNFHLSQPVLLAQQHDTLQHESIVQQGDLVLVPAGQATYWRAQTEDSALSNLSIFLQPELIAQTAALSDLDPDRLELRDYFSRSDPRLHHVAMMLLAELQADGIMGELYVESLTQVLVIHLLRHYSSLQPKSGARHNLKPSRLRIAIDYIHAHLDRDLSMAEIAGSVNTSPTYFASLFKAATGISLHQYVIRQRVDRAQLLLKTTSLPIANIASLVGFANASHLTYHCKRLTGMTPRQIANRAI
jgi:AraC family transcriptional regulator